MYGVKFKYQDERFVYPKLVIALNKLCKDYKKNCLCTSGYRSIEKQKVINTGSLRSHKGAYQRSDGSVYTPDGKCWAAAYGKSNHCYCIAMDITDDWFNKLTNAQLKKYGLIKPMSYEPWHVQLLEHQGISQTVKEQIKKSCIKGVCASMDIKDLQVILGLTADGIIGPKTKAKAQEMIEACQKILKGGK